MDLREKPNWSREALHDFENCLCDRGKKGEARLGAANEKRRTYYKTAEEIATKKKFREKAAVKNIFSTNFQ